MTNEWSNLAIQEKFRKNTLIFILFGANQNLGQFETLIRNEWHSIIFKIRFSKCSSFQNAKTLCNKTSHRLSH